MPEDGYHILDATNEASYDSLVTRYSQGWVDDPKKRPRGPEWKQLIFLVKYTEEELAEMADRTVPGRVELGPIEEMYDFSVKMDPTLSYDTSIEDLDVIDPLNMAFRNGFDFLKEYSGKVRVVRRGDLGRRVNIKHWVKDWLKFNGVTFTGVKVDDPETQIRQAIYDEVIVQHELMHDVAKRRNRTVDEVEEAVEWVAIGGDHPVSVASLEACKAEVLKIWGINITIEELEHYVK